MGGSGRLRCRHALAIDPLSQGASGHTCHDHETGWQVARSLVWVTPSLAWFNAACGIWCKTEEGRAVADPGTGLSHGRPIEKIAMVENVLSG